MKIVHSFWSKPAFLAEQTYDNTRKWGGWLSVKHALLSSCFSCLSARRHHGLIELHTDDAGFDLLINKLQLPYDSVKLSLNALQDAPYQLWVSGKLAAYNHQQTPFIHIDNDVYLWAALPSRQNGNYLITQSPYPLTNDCAKTLADVFHVFDYIPECIRRQGIPAKLVVGNAGILGGNDIDLIQEYCTLARNFVEWNHEALTKIDIGNFNMILEEYLFICLAKERGKNITYLKNVPLPDFFKSVLRFHLVPFIDKYVHLVGFAKQNAYACEQLELHLAYEFSDYYKKALVVIEELVPKPEAPFIDSRRKKRAFNAFSIIYNESLQQLLQRKIRLSGEVFFKEVVNPQSGESEWIMRLNGNEDASNAVKLEGQDELLTCFESPISMDDLLAALKEEAGASDELFEEQKNRLIDFVMEKIVVEGILEFV